MAPLPSRQTGNDVGIGSNTSPASDGSRLLTLILGSDQAETFMVGAWLVHACKLRTMRAPTRKDGTAR
jgi:hypothetical protein